MKCNVIKFILEIAYHKLKVIEVVFNLSDLSLEKQMIEKEFFWKSDLGFSILRNKLKKKQKHILNKNNLRFPEVTQILVYRRYSLLKIEVTHQKESQGSSSSNYYHNRVQVMRQNHLKQQLPSNQVETKNLSLQKNQISTDQVGYEVSPIRKHFMSSIQVEKKLLLKECPVIQSLTNKVSLEQPFKQVHSGESTEEDDKSTNATPGQSPSNIGKQFQGYSKHMRHAVSSVELGNLSPEKVSPSKKVLTIQSRLTASDIINEDSESEDEDYNSDLDESLEHQIWDNDVLLLRGIDCEQWINSDGTPFSLFNLYKARHASHPNSPMPISNQEVLTIMKRFSRNKRNKNVAERFPWENFNDNRTYSDDMDLYNNKNYKIFLDHFNVCKKNQNHKYADSTPVSSRATLSDAQSRKQFKKNGRSFSQISVQSFNLKKVSDSQTPSIKTNENDIFTFDNVSKIQTNELTSNSSITSNISQAKQLIRGKHGIQTPIITKIQSPLKPEFPLIHLSTQQQEKQGDLHIHVISNSVGARVKQFNPPTQTPKLSSQPIQICPPKPPISFLHRQVDQNTFALMMKRLQNLSPQKGSPTKKQGIPFPFKCQLDKIPSGYQADSPIPAKLKTQCGSLNESINIVQHYDSKLPLGQIIQSSKSKLSSQTNKQSLLRLSYGTINLGDNSGLKTSQNPKVFHLKTLNAQFHQPIYLNEIISNNKITSLK